MFIEMLCFLSPTCLIIEISAYPKISVLRPEPMIRSTNQHLDSHRYFRRVIEQVFWILMFFQLDKNNDLYRYYIPKYVLNFQLQKFNIQHRFHLWIILYTSYFMRPPAHLNDLQKNHLSFITQHTKKHTASTHSFVAHPPRWRSKQAGSIVTSMRDGNWHLPN